MVPFSFGKHLNPSFSILLFFLRFLYELYFGFVLNCWWLWKVEQCNLMALIHMCASSAHGVLEIKSLPSTSKALKRTDVMGVESLCTAHAQGRNSATTKSALWQR